MNGLRAALWRRTGGHWWMKNGKWAGNVRSQPRRPAVGLLHATCLLDATRLHPQQRGHRVREGILPLCSALVRPAPGVLCPALEPSAQDRPGAVGAGPEEATAMIWGLEPLCWKERLGELGLFSLEMRRLWAALRAAFQYWKGVYKRAGEGHFYRHGVTGQGVTASSWKGGDSVT